MNKIFAAILAACMMFCLSACSSYQDLFRDHSKITSDQFEEIITGEGFTLAPPEDRPTNADISYCMTATKDDIRVTFYVFRTVESAHIFFVDEKSRVDDEEFDGQRKTLSLMNYEKFSLESDESYQMITRVDGTILFVSTTADEKDYVLEFAKTLDY